MGLKLSTMYFFSHPYYITFQPQDYQNLEHATFLAAPERSEEEDCSGVQCPERRYHEKDEGGQIGRLQSSEKLSSSSP